MSERHTDERIRRMVLAALLTAIVVISTMFLAIPIPNITGAYINAGDAAVFVCAFVLGGPFGATAAAVGSALADIFLGSLVYAPATFVIKWLMAYVASLLFTRFKKRKLPALLCAELIMPAGYFIYEWMLLNSVAVAAAGLLFNLMQYCGGVLIGLFCIKAVALIKK